MFWNLPDKRQIIAGPFSQKWLVIYSMLFAHIHCLENTWTEISAFLKKRTGSPDQTQPMMCISITSNKISSCRIHPLCRRGRVKSKFYIFMIEGKSQIVSSDTIIQIKMAQRESTYCNHN